MGVSQQAIADVLGLSRTTVTKILNRDPKYSASEATRELVFRTAEKMGYDFTTIRRPFKREYGRTEINAPCEIDVIMENGEVFDRGVAVARNIGVGGALITNIRTEKMAMPLKTFMMRIRFQELPALASLVGECQVVRVTDSVDAGEPELGVKFINASVNDRKILKEYIDRAVAEQQAAKAAAIAKREADEGLPTVARAPAMPQPIYQPPPTTMAPPAGYQPPKF